jgi:hypothetical protein
MKDEMIIKPEMIKFQEFDDPETHHIDYESIVQFPKCTTRICKSALSQYGDKIEYLNHIRQHHLENHDHVVYGQFRKEMKITMTKFMDEILNYDTGNSWRSTVDIPKTDIHTLRVKLQEIIIGLD